MSTLRLKKYEPLEKEIQNACLEYLHAKRIFCWKEHSSGMMIDGGERFMPLGLKGKADILGLLKNGRFLAIEVKRPSGVVAPHQQEFLDNINRNGGLAFVARDVDDIINHGI